MSRISDTREMAPCHILYAWLIFSLCVSSYANWMHLGLVGVPAPLQQQEAEAGMLTDDPGYLHASAICSALTGLILEQIEVCMKHPNLIYSVANGAHRGIEECQYQFRDERWNCTTRVEDENVFGSILEAGSKETAFIYAITSAGVVHAVTQGCSAGDLTECNCDSSNHGKNTPEGWKWGGCSDNIQYGIDFARKFVDAEDQVKTYINYDTKMKNRIHMNLHNNEAGRQVVSDLMRMHCRCHGVSGSCELKTCWKMMPSFNEVGDTLKKKYGKAILLKHPKSPIRSKRNRNKIRREIKDSDLVHVSKSPNYCRTNAKKGILGTEGRRCEKNSKGSNSCSSLCCGRGFITKVTKVSESCSCKFFWCCYIKCKTCNKEIETHHCK